jgi:hypothetical protein
LQKGERGSVDVPERNAAYWSNKAEEARTRTDQMHDPTAKQTMLDIAASYDRMAQRAEGREVRSRTNPKKPRTSN